MTKPINDSDWTSIIDFCRKLGYGELRGAKIKGGKIVSYTQKRKTRNIPAASADCQAAMVCDKPLPRHWQELIAHCEKLGEGEIAILRIRDGLPVHTEEWEGPGTFTY